MPSKTCIEPLRDAGKPEPPGRHASVTHHLLDLLPVFVLIPVCSVGFVRQSSFFPALYYWASVGGGAVLARIYHSSTADEFSHLLV